MTPPYRAAVIEQYAAAPTLAEREPLPGGAIVELRAAALNPADLAIASGTFPAGSPPLPYVPGIDGIGVVVASERFAPGTRVGVLGGGVGVARDGTWAERFAAPESALLPVLDGVDDVTAAALLTPGLTAWLALTHVAELGAGESVLVLGATGTLGSVAVQAARQLGAGRVVAVGRDAARLERSRGRGADATVAADGDGLVDALREAVGDHPPDVVVDPIFGPGFEAALAVAAPAARIVHVGQSSAPTASLASGLLRGKRLTLQGMSVFFVDRDVLEAGYTALLEHARDGRVTVDDVEAVPLERAAEAWAAKAAGQATKFVITP
jgi:NADPH:quinone reductase-like Zn-dependent oxidoreductase